MIANRYILGLCMSMILAVWVHRAEAKPVTSFESGQVRPMALSPDGSRLYVVNTPDDRLEIFTIDAGGLTHLAAVPVGVEPVSVAARTNSEVWVVNHLSDSVSIVDVSATPPRVTRTLLVGDEPRDIVFGGAAHDRAFITSAHRGQNRPGFDPQLTTASIGRADVFVFDANNLGSTLEGTPLTVVSLFGDTPRALAVTPDGSTVYAAVFHSGNRTTTVSDGAVCDTNGTNLNNNTVQGSCNIFGTVYPGGLPLPHRSSDGVVRPEVGLIVRYNATASQWRDQLNRNWNNAVRFNLPDKDVFAINANANPPVQSSFVTGVGTILYNMAVNPLSGSLYVTNTEARNEVRFEGPGVLGGSTVRGHQHEARITVINGSTVTPRHLNKHINYAVYPAPESVRDDSLATPLQMALTSNGATLYVAAFGSSKVGIFDTAALEANTFTPDSTNQIPVSGGGPSGLILDEAYGRLYVMTRFDNSVSVIDTTTKEETAHIPLYNPEPPTYVNGRRFLYDASFTSSNGEASCSSCHAFGDFDSLAWDLGNPDDVVLQNLNPIRVDNVIDQFAPGFFVSSKNFHPMKGPMTTQSLRGMANAGPMHWRGDRSGGNDVDGNPLDEDAAFKRFNGAFAGLLGRSGPLTDTEMQAFTDFILQVKYPPNPIRNLDNSLTSDQEAGRVFFHQPANVDVFQNCNGCHVHDKSRGFFGTDGFSSFEAEPQFFKIAHLRNLYQKIGMFGMPAVQFFNSGDNGAKGDQIRGFGFLHDGSTDTVFRFLQAQAFNQDQPLLETFIPNPNPGGFTSDAAGDAKRRQIEAFLLAMDSDVEPVVGQQTTLTSSNSATVGSRIDLFLARAGAGECDLVAQATIGGEARGWYFDGSMFHSDLSTEAAISDSSLRALAGSAGQEITYTCGPLGSGIRRAVDHDDDGLFNRDEIALGTDPMDPIPSCATGTIAKAGLKISKNDGLAGDEKLKLKGQVVVTGSIDPIANGIQIRIDDNHGATLFVRNVPSGAAPASDQPGWTVNDSGSKWIYKDKAGSFAGVTKVKIVDKSARTPGLITFTLDGVSNFQTDDADAPLRMTVRVGTGADQCGEARFHAATAVAPKCKLSTGNKTISCR